MWLYHVLLDLFWQVRGLNNLTSIKRYDLNVENVECTNFEIWRVVFCGVLWLPFLFLSEAHTGGQTHSGNRKCYLSLGK